MQKFLFSFFAVFIIVILLIVIAGQHIAFFNFDFKDWAIFGLASVVVFLLSGFWYLFHDFKLYNK